MKYNKIFRTLAVAIIISLLVLVIPASPAAAAAITLSPTSERAGSTVTITGSGFTSGTSVRIDFRIDSTYSPRQWITLTTTTFSTTFTVPTTASVGSHLVRAVDDDTGTVLASAYFTVISPEIDIYPNDGPVGTEVTIDGIGFYAGGLVTFYYYNGTQVELGTETADPRGECSYSFAIPESTAGDHTITVTGDDSNLEAEAEFTVDSEISLSPISEAAGTEVTVSGTGFEDDEDITIYFAGSKIDTTPASIETNDVGSFSGIFIVPVKVRDTYTVKASDGTNKHSVEFTITAGTSLSSTTGNVSTELTVSGTGFIASGTVTIKYDETQIATATTDADGAFSTIFDIPASLHGDHTITASDGANVQQLTFTMESTAPPTPQPLLPEDSIKTKAEAYFDWDDVDDPSGVTYTLQIATDKDFAFTVLKKEGLTISEYTITKEEKLESTKKEAPYYWQVKAIDGASNESQWSTPGSFYIGFQWPELKGWLLFLVIGVGALLIGLLGFWLGRRTAYSSSFY